MLRLPLDLLRENIKNKATVVFFSIIELPIVYVDSNDFGDHYLTVTKNGAERSTQNPKNLSGSEPSKNSGY